MPRSAFSKTSPPTPFGMEISIFLLMSLFLFSSLTAPCQADEETAADVARNWLGRIDDGGYSESWETAARAFKTGVSEKQWREKLTEKRKLLGKPVSRKLRSERHETGLPGLPCSECGEYVIMEYDAAFGNHPSVRETITLMRDDGGTWRVADYYVRYGFSKK